MFRTFTQKVVAASVALVTVILLCAALVLTGHLTVSTAGFIGSASGMVVFGSFLTQDDAIKYLIAIGWLDSAGGVKRFIKAKTADYTVVTGTDPSGTIFTNRGAVGAVNFTLPAAAQGIAGVFYDFLGVANQNIVVIAATADTLIVVNDTAADSLAMSTANQKIGSCIRVVCDGTAWVAFGYAIGAGGDTGTNTYTVAT